MSDATFENWVKRSYRRMVDKEEKYKGQGILESQDTEKAVLRPFISFTGMYKPFQLIAFTSHALDNSYNEYPYAVFFDSKLTRDFNRLLWNKYASFHPFDSITELVSRYPVLYNPMMSQRGSTCSVDAMFTILFESEHLRPLFYTPDYGSMTSGVIADDGCCIALPPTTIMTNLSSLTNVFGKNLAVTREALRNQYINVMAAAKKRYDRMMSGGNYSKRNNGTRNRRRLSVENTLWEEILYPVRPTCSTIPLLRGGDIAIFFDFLLSTNGLNLPTLDSHSPFQVNLYSKEFLAPASFDTKNIIAFVMLLIPIDHKEDSAVNHYIGMYRNGDTWFLVDNEVGYIHQVMDTDWVNSIMLPRLFTTLSSPIEISDKKSIAKDADKKIYAIYNNKALKPLFMNVQFITFGERSYPNINPSEFGDPIHFSIIGSICTISKLPTAAAASTGGGSAAAVAATRRRVTRRHRRRRAI